MPVDLRLRWLRTDIAIEWRPWCWRIGTWVVGDGVRWRQFGPIALRYEAEFWF